MSGDLFELPAGPVSTALGFHWRRNTLTDQPDPQSQAQNLFAGSTRPTDGATEVKEAFAQLRVPIFSDRPFARDLSISLAGRVTDQEPSGTDFTYRIGANWTITDEYRIRGTYGTSFRAPAVFERALGSSVLSYRQTIYPGFDPCINPSNPVAAANCLADGIPADYTGTSPNGGTVSAVVTTGGNPDLGPERSTAWTIGAVWSPSFINFRAAVDYWHINLTDEISTLQGGAVGLCYNSPDFPNDPYCSLFARDRNSTSPTFLNILTVNDNFLNLAQRTKSGIDVTLNFEQEIGAATRLDLGAQLSWVLKSTSISRPGATERNVNNSVYFPGFGGLINARLDHGPWSVAWNLQIIGEGSNIREAGNTELGSNPHAIGQVRYRRSVELVTYSDVSLRREFENFSVQVGIQNLFNRRPPPISSEYQYRRGESTLPFYDLIGRRMYISTSVRF
jgi:iron complex outermembrane receptor protein